MYVMENEQELYCQTISMGKFFDVKKRSLKFQNLALKVLEKSLNFLCEKVCKPCEVSF